MGDYKLCVQTFRENRIIKNKACIGMDRRKRKPDCLEAKERCSNFNSTAAYLYR